MNSFKGKSSTVVIICLLLISICTMTFAATFIWIDPSTMQPITDITSFQSDYFSNRYIGALIRLDSEFPCSDSTACTITLSKGLPPLLLTAPFYYSCPLVLSQIPFTLSTAMGASLTILHSDDTHWSFSLPAYLQNKEFSYYCTFSLQVNSNTIPPTIPPEASTPTISANLSSTSMLSVTFNSNKNLSIGAYTLSVAPKPTSPQLLDVKFQLGPMFSSLARNTIPTTNINNQQPTFNCFDQASNQVGRINVSANLDQNKLTPEITIEVLQATKYITCQIQLLHTVVANQLDPTSTSTPPAPNSLSYTGEFLLNFPSNQPILSMIIPYSFTHSNVPISRVTTDFTFDFETSTSITLQGLFLTSKLFLYSDLAHFPLSCSSGASPSCGFFEGYSSIAKLSQISTTQFKISLDPFSFSTGKYNDLTFVFFEHDVAKPQVFRWLPSIQISNDSNHPHVIIDDSIPSILSVTTYFISSQLAKGHGLALSLPIFSFLQLDPFYPAAIRCDLFLSDQKSYYFPTFTKFVEDVIYLELTESPPEFASANLKLQCYLRIHTSVDFSIGSGQNSWQNSQFWDFIHMSTTSAVSLFPVHPVLGTDFQSHISFTATNFESTDSKADYDVLSGTHHCVKMVRFDTQTLIDAATDNQIENDLNLIRKTLVNSIMQPNFSGYAIFPFQDMKLLAAVAGSTKFTSPWVHQNSAFRNLGMDHAKTDTTPTYFSHSALIFATNCNDVADLAQDYIYETSTYSAILPNPSVTLHSPSQANSLFYRTLAGNELIDLSAPCYGPDGLLDPEKCKVAYLFNSSFKAIFQPLHRQKGRLQIFKKSFGAPCKSHSECLFSCEFEPTTQFNDRSGKCSNNPNGSINPNQPPPPSLSIFSAANRADDTAFKLKIGFDADKDTFVTQCGLLPTPACCERESTMYCVCLIGTTHLDLLAMCAVLFPHLKINAHSEFINPNSCFFEYTGTAVPTMIGNFIPLLHQTPLRSLDCHKQGYFTQGSLETLAKYSPPSPRDKSAQDAFLPNQLFLQTDVANATIFKYIPIIEAQTSSEALVLNDLTSNPKPKAYIFWSPTHVFNLLNVTQAEDLLPSDQFSLSLSGKLEYSTSIKNYSVPFTRFIKMVNRAQISLGVEGILLSLQLSSVSLVDISIELNFIRNGIDQGALLGTPVHKQDVTPGYSLQFHPTITACENDALVYDTISQSCICPKEGHMWNAEYNVCAPPCQCGQHGKCQYFKKSTPNVFATAADSTNGDINFYNYQCVCTTGWSHRFCDVPTTCRTISCLDTARNVDPLALPISSRGSDQCDTKCPQCVVGFQKDANTNKCVCIKSVEQCDPIGSHPVSFTASRCVLNESRVNPDLDSAAEYENVSDLEPWLKNSPCTCNLGYAGKRCDRKSINVLFALLDPISKKLPEDLDILTIFQSNRELRKIFYKAMKKALAKARSAILQFSPTSSLTLYMSLYYWNSATQEVTLQLWLEEPLAFTISETTQTDSFVESFHQSDVLEEQIYTRMLSSTGHAMQQLANLQKMRFDTQDTSPDLSDLFNLWDKVAETPPDVGVVDQKQSAYPSLALDPRCADTAFAAVHDCSDYIAPKSYDDQYNAELSQDKNQTLFSISLGDQPSSRASTTTIIIIAVVVPVGAILLFIIIALSIRHCYKNNKLCFEKKRRKTTSNSIQSTELSPSVNNSSVSGFSAGSNSSGASKNSSLPASIMPSNPASLTTTSTLPAGWQLQTDHATGKTYYMNMETMQSQWHHPSSSSTQPEQKGW